MQRTTETEQKFNLAHSFIKDCPHLLITCQANEADKTELCCDISHTTDKNLLFSMLTGLFSKSPELYLLGISSLLNANKKFKKEHAGILSALSHGRFRVFSTPLHERTAVATPNEEAPNSKGTVSSILESLNAHGFKAGVVNLKTGEGMDKMLKDLADIQAAMKNKEAPAQSEGSNTSRSENERIASVVNVLLRILKNR